MAFSNACKDGLTKGEALEDLYDKLSSLQAQLGAAYSRKEILKDRLQAAVKGESFAEALKCSPPQTVADVVERLQHSMLGEKKEDKADKNFKEAVINFAQSTFGNASAKRKNDSKHKSSDSKSSTWPTYGKDHSSCGPPPSDEGRKLNDIGRNGKRLRCFIDGSERHLTRDHLSCSKKSKAHHAKDFLEQAGSSSDDDQDSSSDSDEEQNADSNYVNLASSALKGRSDMHSMMGVSEASCSRRSANFRGALIDAGAQEPIGGKKQHLEYLKHEKAPHAPVKPSSAPHAFGDSASKALLAAPIRFSRI